MPKGQICLSYPQTYVGCFFFHTFGCKLLNRFSLTLKYPTFRSAIIWKQLNLLELLWYVGASSRESLSSGFMSMSDINRAVQPHKVATGLKFGIKKVEFGENKGTQISCMMMIS